jgi:two-component system, OmpR family, sensor histidine kinase KdpD
MGKSDDSRSAGPVVVALGPGSEGATLIEAASAIAKGEGRKLECLTVDQGWMLKSDAAERLAANKDLARSLGASVLSAPGIDAAQAILDHARAASASTIVVGGTGKRRGGGIARELMAARRSFSVVAIALPVEADAGGNRWRRLASGGDAAAHYAAAFAMVALVTLANLALASYAGFWAAAILYLAAISLGALWLGFGPILFAALLSAVAWDFLFIPPRFHITIDRTEDVLMLALYVLVSVCSGLATSRLRSSERLLRDQQAKLSKIFELALALVGADTPYAILAKGIASIEGSSRCEAIAILKGDDGKLRHQAESGWEPLNEDARAAAALCFEEGKDTGRFTGAWPSSEWRFLGLDSPKGRLGVIGLRPPHDADWDEGVEAYAKTSVSTIALALARELS